MNEPVVMPSVHVLQRSVPLQCWTYLVAGPEGAVLVDPGSGVCEGAINAEIRRCGLALEDVRYVLLTHCHVDHAGGAHLYRERGMKLVASPTAAGKLRAASREVWYEYPAYVIPTRVDLMPTDGERLDLCGLSVTAVYTPGHTAGSTSYLFDGPDGAVAFTGDMLEGDGGLAWAGSEDFCEDAVLASVAKLLALAPARAFWGHGVVARPATAWLRDGLALGRAGRWRRVTARHPEHRPPALLRRRVGSE